VPEALEYGQRALELAEQFQDNSVRAHALNNIGCALLISSAASGIAKLEESLAVALDNNLHDHAGRSYANLVSMAVDHHLAIVAARYIPEGGEYCEVHEVHDCLTYIRAYAAHFELNAGHWNEAAQLAGRLIERHSLPIAQRLPAQVVLGLVRARRGDPGAEQLLDEAMRMAQPTGELQRIGRIAAASAEAAWYQGDTPRTAERACLGLRAAVGKHDTWLVGQLAFWASRSDPTLHVPSDIAEPYARMIAGDWQAAADAWRALNMPYERALALAEGPEEALRESLGLLEQLGAGPLGAIVRRRLRERGVRGLPRGPRASTRENPAGLTSREIQVLTLLVRGHTNTELANRLHVSIRTVDHHVSSILEKLDVRSRTEAVAAAFGLGIVKPGS
jgi:DNA-binding CsgD family transcriptional regulator